MMPPTYDETMRGGALKSNGTELPIMNAPIPVVTSKLTTNVILFRRNKLIFFFRPLHFEQP